MRKGTRGLYQKEAYRANKTRIIRLLNKEPLTFTELIEKSGLSRGTVHTQLKKMGDLIVKKYESGKILNVLQTQNLDLVQWFLNQLRTIHVPEKLLKKGKDVLDPAVIIGPMYLYYIKIWHDLLLIDEIYLKKSRGKIVHSLMTPIKMLSNINTPHVLDADVTIKSERTGERAPEIEIEVKRVVGELNPLTFHIGLSTYRWEKQINLTTKEESTLFGYSYLGDEMKQSLDKVLRWWEEVSEYIPGVSLVSIFIGKYVASLLSNKREMEKLYEQDPALIMLKFSQ